MAAALGSTAHPRFGAVAGRTGKGRSRQAGPEGGSSVLSFVVQGVAWYADRRGEVYLLPAETAVTAVAVARAAFGADRLPLWRLPSGGVPVAPDRLPLEPVPVDDVFPLGAAEIPWTPAPLEGDVPDLSRSWHLLFRERDAFEPWGDESDDAAFRAFLRGAPPRSTFRAGVDRRSLRYLFPQWVPPSLAYRMTPRYFRLPQRDAFAPVVTEAEELRLDARGGTGRARLRRGPEGWRLRVTARGREEDHPPAADLSELLVRHLEPLGSVWSLAPVELRSSWLILPGRP
jgi:hypothetical protein